MAHDTALQFHITGMSCASCVGRVEKALAEVSNIKMASVNLANETATIALTDPAGWSATAAELQRVLQVTGYPAVVRRDVLDIAGMSCASCVRRVEQALLQVPGVLSASVNLASEQAQIEYLEGSCTIADLKASIDLLGYTATAPSAAEPDHALSAHGRKAEALTHLQHNLIWAAILAVPVFLLEMGAHLLPGMHEWIGYTLGHQTSRVIQFALTTLILLGPGRVFAAKGWPALFRRTPDMNSLVALGTGSAWAYSTLATFAPALFPDTTGNVYFESAAVIVVLILGGRYLEARAKGHTSAAIQTLLGLQPKTARVVRGEMLVDVPIADIHPGDTVQAHPGEKIAVDGVVLEGHSWIDESMLTGEPIPVARVSGDPVSAGTLNGHGTLRYRATRVGGDTLLAQIVRLVERAQGAKLPIQSVVDRVTGWFVPAVISLALLTVLYWLITGHSAAFALVAGVAVLIIACPCAMGLATPTSIMVGTGRAAELGVLFRHGDALQSLQQTQIVALDKTGTLTEGRPALTDLIVLEPFEKDRVLALIAAVESRSEHPIARAIRDAAIEQGLQLTQVDEFESLPGYGVAATVSDHRILIGNARLMLRENVDTAAVQESMRTLTLEGKTPLHAAIDGELAALAAVADPIKSTTPAAIRAMHQMGLSVAMITGDNQQSAQAIAVKLGIDKVIADVLPEGKVLALNELRGHATGDGPGRIAFVGDGINDAPALASADVGIAIGTGTDVAIESADIVLMSGNLEGVVNALQISRATLRNIRQNLFWAFAYNIVLIPVAAGILYPHYGILLSPMLAALAMALSSVFVVTNALRLRKLTPMLTSKPEVVSHVRPAQLPIKGSAT